MGTMDAQTPDPPPTNDLGNLRLASQVASQADSLASASAPASYNDQDQPHQSQSQDTQPTPNRTARACEKQRARRQAKRAAKREVSAQLTTTITTTEEESEETIKTKHNVTPPSTKRHRPTQPERSMHFFLKIYNWSNLFFRNLQWTPYLSTRTNPYLDKRQIDLDTATIEAISAAMRKNWLGEGGTRQFRSASDLERFIASKKAEASYIEKQLKTMPDLQDSAWAKYFNGTLIANKSEAVGETLAGPADFMRGTILPCLKAQIQALDARLVKARRAERRLSELHAKRERQIELRAVVDSLRKDQALLLPICPVWKEVEDEITKARAEILDKGAGFALVREVEVARLAYEESLVV